MIGSLWVGVKETIVGKKVVAESRRVGGFWAVPLRTKTIIVRHTNPPRLIGNLSEFEKSDKGSLLSLR